ncbi:hypothetical protein JHK87_016277 [Glycine soja]|nr:hypothetical protein JHK87_016277 [Glycine soja]
MGWKRSGFEWERVNIYGQVLLGFLYICTIQTSSAVTDSTDAYILHYDPLFFLDGLLVAEIHVEKGGKAFCAMDHSYKKYKLGKRAFAHQKDDEFIELINNIDRIRHANVVEPVGYCSEHDQKASNL